MLVYRVQDNSGIGPYISGHDVNLNTKGKETHPLPHEDGIGKWWELPHTYRCGFESLRKLGQWFNVEDREALDRHFEVVEFEVPDEHVIVGRCQVVFDIEHATMLRRAKPTLVSELA